MTRLLSISLLLLTACHTLPPPTKGGGTTQRMEQPPAIVQTLAQPESPDTPSRQEIVEIRTETLPSGATITTETRALTELGGSQDQAAYLAAWAKVKQVSQDRVRDVLIGLALMVAAAVAWKRDNPLIASTLALGALGSMFLHAGYGGAAVGVSFLLYMAFLKGGLLARLT